MNLTYTFLVSESNCYLMCPPDETDVIEEREKKHKVTIRGGVGGGNPEWGLGGG